MENAREDKRGLQDGLQSTILLICYKIEKRSKGERKKGRLPDKRSRPRFATFLLSNAPRCWLCWCDRGDMNRISLVSDEVDVLGTSTSREIFGLRATEKQNSRLGLVKCVVHPSNTLGDSLYAIESIHQCQQHGYAKWRTKFNKQCTIPRSVKMFTYVASPLLLGHQLLGNDISELRGQDNVSS